MLGTLENIGFVANMSTMVLYFHRVLLFDVSTSANTLTNFLGSTFLLTILGGFISDAYLNRLYTCLIFGFLEITVRKKKKYLCVASSDVEKILSTRAVLFMD